MTDETDSNFDLAIGRRLISLRETAGLTRVELASKTNIPLTDLIAYEDGSQRLGARRMFAICTCLKIKPAQLLNGLQADGREGHTLHDKDEPFEP